MYFVRITASQFRALAMQGFMMALTLTVVPTNLKFAAPNQSIRDYEIAANDNSNLEPEFIKPEEPGKLDEMHANRDGEPVPLLDEEAPKLPPDVPEKLNATINSETNLI